MGLLRGTGARPRRVVLGRLAMITLPEITRERFDAVLFDLDGVLTATATVHAAAWKQMFDMFLQGWAEAHGRDFIPFDSGEDYRRYVDGKPRFDGVRSFLVSRGIDLPDGAPTDPLTAETVCGLGNHKNALVNEIMAREGVEAYPGSVRVHGLRFHLTIRGQLMTVGHRGTEGSGDLPPSRGDRAHHRSSGRGSDARARPTGFTTLYAPGGFLIHPPQSVSAVWARHPIDLSALSELLLAAPLRAPALRTAQPARCLTGTAARVRH